MKFMYSAALGALIAGAVHGTGANAAEVSPNVIVGSGVTNGSFTLGTGTYDGNDLELGLRGKLRFNASNSAENTFNETSPGTYTFEAGAAPTGFSWDKNSPTTPVWSFEWHVNSDVDDDSDSATALSALTYELRLDGDPTAGTNFAVFDPFRELAYFDHAFGTANTGQSDGEQAPSWAITEYQSLFNDSTVAQNSWNYEFFNGPEDAPNNPILPELANFDPELNGTYRIEFEAFLGEGADRISVASTGIDIVVEGGTDPSVVPLPAGLPLLAAALGGLAMWRRRSA